jgi:hypothetical protein
LEWGLCPGRLERKKTIGKKYVEDCRSKIKRIIDPHFKDTLNPPQQHLFITGNLAMMVTSDWFINTMRTYAPEIDYDITYISSANAGNKPSTWAGGWTFVVPTGSKKKEAAVRFVHLMKPVIAVVAIFTALGAWNDFLGPPHLPTKPADVHSLDRSTVFQVST